MFLSNQRLLFSPERWSKLLARKTTLQMTSRFHFYTITKTDSFYADVIEFPETFWKSALKKGLDPSVADKQGESF